MTFSLHRVFQFLLIAALSVCVTLPQNLFAQDHVVSAEDLQKDVQAAASARDRHIAQIDNLLSSAEGQQALESAHASYQQVQKAVASLDDAELARLSARAQLAQNDFAAGRISNRGLILIILAIVIIVLLIVLLR